MMWERIRNRESEKHQEANTVKGDTEPWQEEYWKSRNLTPAQIWTHDIRLAQNPFHMQNQGPWFELYETLSSTFIPDLEHRDAISERLQAEPVTPNRQEQAKLENLANQYGWVNCLRSKGVQQTVDDDPSFRKCRWIHVSSKYPDHLLGLLFALSDWDAHEKAPQEIYAQVRQLEQCIAHNERFSKHGRYFSPFFEPLNGKKAGPMLLSVPFLDWTVEGEPPPPRFNIDRRDQWQSSRSSSHPLRSILQHFYRLEDTSERESLQVFSRHKPWATDSSLDLKIRRWYGAHPGALNVDELWILVVDERHIVTFSSNQTWKSRWPPLQVASRIGEVSFRGIRNSLSMSEIQADYNAYSHIVASLSGALGILHRSFWTDMPLCLTDRYAGYLSHLQYRLLRSPSTKLVMDLLQVQEELNIIIQIMQQQLSLIDGLSEEWDSDRRDNNESKAHSRSSSVAAYPHSLPPFIFTAATKASFKQFAPATLRDPMEDLNDSLKREFTDLCELRDNANNLVNRTIQLVNIRLEDHGRAVMVFTVITIIFLPLSFVASFLGMNTSDIRNMENTQSLFWTISLSLTVGVVLFSLLLAFYGGTMVERFFIWKANRVDRKREKFD